MVEAAHPFYEMHRGAMEAVMRHRLELAAAPLRAHRPRLDLDRIRREVMDEFEVVLAQMPYVGGGENRMSDFFMRLLGFMALGRVLRRHGVPPPAVGQIARETLKAQLLTVPEAERLASGDRFLSPENRELLRAQARRSRDAEFADDFVYDIVEPAPGQTFEFGIDYRSCGFCTFAARHGDAGILPAICGLDFDAYAALGIHLERTQTLAGGANRCDFRFSRRPPADPGGRNVGAHGVDSGPLLQEGSSRDRP